jgi:hypothetical protein
MANAFAEMAASIGATPPTSPGGTPMTPNRINAFRATRIVNQTLLQQLMATLAPPPLIPQPVMVAPAVVPVAPRCGGLALVNTQQVPWTGGGTTPQTTVTVPASSFAFRSSDLSTALKVEKACTEGLADARRLPAPGVADMSNLGTVVTFADWLYMLKNALVERGLDSIFRTMINGVEVFLLEKWGQATKENIDAQIAFLEINGDEYDRKNLKLSAKFILNSLDMEMLRRTENELGNALNQAASGLEVFAAIIALHSVLNDSTERFYTDKLKSMHLVDEPGQDVATFSNKVLSIARHIDGISEHRVKDLHTLIYQCYKGSTTVEFAAAVAHLLSQCFNNDITVRDWEAKVAMLKSMYRNLIGLQTWEATKHKKESGEPQGLAAQVKRLTKMVNSAGLSEAKKTDSKPFICFWCGEKGHKKPDCPNLDKPMKYVAPKEKGSKSPANTNQNEFKARAGPKQGEPTTKTVKGTQYKWCDTCKKWNSGDKAHHTVEHVKGKGASGAAGALAEAVPVETPSLSFVAGYIGAATVQTVNTNFIPSVPRFIKGEFGHYSILSELCTHSETPGAVWCESCQQHFVQWDHKSSDLHKKNFQMHKRWKYSTGEYLSIYDGADEDPEDWDFMEPDEQVDCQVENTKYMYDGHWSIVSNKATSNEENPDADFCPFCQQSFLQKDHWTSSLHYKNVLLSRHTDDMSNIEDFKCKLIELNLISEEEPMEIDVDEDGFTLVKHKSKRLKTHHLNMHTG